MNDLRLWVLVLALTSFAAGAGLGVWGTASRLSGEPPRSTFADYEQLLAQRFELSPERRKLLSHVLESYEQDIREIQDRRSAELMSSMEPELAERGRYYRSLIQDNVLPERQRAEFAHLAHPSPSHR